MDIKIPRKPRVKQKETAPDKRKFAVVPMAAISDKRLNNFQFRVLVAVASYANRAGVCYVGQRKLADDLKTHQPHISLAMTKLKDTGHIVSIGKPITRIRGETVRVVFDASLNTEEAVSVASAGTDEDLRPPEQREVELAEAMMMQEKQWTEKELRENKERLAKLLNDAFKTTGDKPHLYTPVAGDTAAVKKIKQEIRGRMRQIRGEQLAREYQQAAEPIHQDISKHNILCSDTPECIVNIENKESDTSECILNTVSKHGERLEYEAIVVILNKQLNNGVQTESDLQTCALLAQHNVTRETLDQYIKQHSSDTVAQIGERILGTVCK